MSSSTPAADRLSSPGRRRAADAPRRDHPRVVARELASPGALAGAGRRGRPAARPAPPGGAPVAGEGQAGRPAVEPGRRTASMRSGGSATRAALSELEEAFAAAMTSLADPAPPPPARSRDRCASWCCLRWRRALSLLWRRSVQETRRAEARKLIALGRVELDRNPAAALAFARASLEVSDSAEARQLAVESLWAGPPTFFVADAGQCLEAAFSLAGRHLACGGFYPDITVLSDGGGEQLRIPGLPEKLKLRGVAFTPSGDRLLSWLEGDPASASSESKARRSASCQPRRQSCWFSMRTQSPRSAQASPARPNVRCASGRSPTGRRGSSRVGNLPPDSGSSLPGFPPAAIDLQLSWLAYGEDSRGASARPCRTGCGA